MATIDILSDGIGPSWAAVRTTARGDRGARDHLRATPHRLVECGDLATGRDLDTAEDLRRG